MARLTRKQIERLGASMDRRWQRKWDEVQAVTQRSLDERDQQTLAGTSTDLSDAASQEILVDADDTIVRQDVQNLRDIAAARQRIAAGTYGTCIDCGADIGHARLRAYPTAKRCIECQLVHEGRGLGRSGAV